MEVQTSGMPCFLCRSLLLSTIILNDKSTIIMYNGRRKLYSYTTTGNDSCMYL